MVLPASVPRVVAIGGSAGAVEGLRAIFSRLPESLDAAVLVVLHLPMHGGSHLPEILSRAGPLRARTAHDGEPLAAGRVYVARPDRHLLVDRDTVSVIMAPKENRARPALDPLFRSVALQFGSRGIGVLLSGVLNDGVAGLWALKRAGGTVVVQDPQDALFSQMPQDCLDHVEVDLRLPAREIGPALARLASEPLPQRKPSDAAALEQEAQWLLKGKPEAASELPGVQPSGVSCPECGGGLWGIDQDPVVRFRCRTGHSYTLEHLVRAKDQGVDSALWEAIRALQENGELRLRMAERAQKAGLSLAAEAFEKEAELKLKRSDVLKQLLAQLRGDPEPPVSTESQDHPGDDR